MNVIRNCLTMLLVAVVAPAYVRGQSAEDEQAFRQAVALADPSIVRIETVGGLDVIGDLLTGSGPTTGVVVSEDGYVITSSFNFISRPASILVTLADGRRLPAEQVANDRSRKLTLLKVEATGLTPLPAAAKGGVRVGQWAIALGRTYDGPFPSLSVGIISALDRIYGRAVQTDAKVSPVNYGGPLVDLDGRGIGILVPLSPQGQEETAGVEWYDSGIGFAVPMADVYAALDRLKSGQDLKPGLMGVTFQGAGVLAGAPIIDRVRPNSPADKAGAQVGDLITAVDGTPVDRLPALMHLLGPRYAGDALTVTIRRGDESHDLPMTLVDELLPYAGRYLGILPERPPRGTTRGGVAVRAVLAGSPAEQSGLQTGDVIRAIGDASPADAAALRDRIGRIEPGQPVSLQVSHGEQLLSLTVTLSGIPNEVPLSAPPAAVPAPVAPAADAPPTGRFTSTLPGEQQEFWAYVPEGYNPDFAYGLLVWLHPSDDTQEAAMLRAWQAPCDQRGIILVAPKAADIGAWTPAESEFVRGVVEHIQGRYSIDRGRIAVCGAGNGGALAWQSAFKHRELYRGIAVVGAPLSRPPPDNDPDYPQQVLAACGAEDPLQPRVAASVELLQQMKFPAVLLEVPGGEVAPAAIAERLAVWLDTLDRI